MNIVRDYGALRPVNVMAVAELARLCAAPRRRGLYVASSLSVFVSTDRHTGTLMEGDDLQDTAWVYGGYAQTKVAAELVLAELHRRCGAGFPLHVVRLGLLTGDSRTARSGPRDWLGLFFRGLAGLGCVPAGDASNICLDVTPVDYAASAMVGLALAATGDERRVFHVCGRHPVTLAALATALSHAGVSLRELDDVQWRRTARARLSRAPGAAAAAVLALCRCLEPSAFHRHRPFDLFQATGARFGTRQLRQVLGDSVVPPEPDLELLVRYAREALAGG